MIDQTPRACVATPAYDAAAFLPATIRSVLAQTSPDFEFIIVDDGSTDDTLAIARAVEDPRVHVLARANGGVSIARNAALAAARAPFILFLDADDLLEPDALERMTAALEAQPDCVACQAHLVRIDEAGALVGPAEPWRGRTLPTRDTLDALLAKNVVVNGGALLLRTEAARAAGGFDPRLMFGEDWEFWCRLALLGDFAPLPEYVAVRYRQRVSGANHRLRGGPLRPNIEAVAAIYANPALAGRIAPARLREARRLAEMDVFWGAARNELAGRRLGPFLRYLITGALLYPDSFLQPRLVRSFLRSGLARSRPAA